MSKYVVKIGDLYSCGRPAPRGTDAEGLDLHLSADKRESWVTADREAATEHAVAWTGDAISNGHDTPRVVKLKGTRK